MAEELEKHNSEKEPDSFDTTGLILDYLAHWKWFVVSVVVCLAVAYFHIATVIPVYKIESAIYLSGGGNEGDSPANPFSLNGDNPLVSMKNYIDETEIEILKSRNNLVQIVDSLNLCYTYYKEGTLRDKPLYQNNPIIASLDSASLHNLKAPIKIKVKQNSDSTYNVEVKTTFNQAKEDKKLENVAMPCSIQLSHGELTLTRSNMIPEFDGTELITIVSPRTRAKQLAGALSIEFAKKSEKIINVAYTDQVPARGIDVINALLDYYNRGIIEDKNRSAVQTEAFILDRLVMITDELRDVENRLQSYRQAHNITDIQVQSNLNLNLQSNYQNQLAEAEADMAVLDDIERIVSTAGTYELLPSAVKDQSINSIIEQYNNRVNQLNRALEGSTTNSPLVTSMQDELNRQKVRIMGTIVSAKRNLNARIANISALEHQSVGELASTPTVDKGLQEIFREQSVKVNIYTFLLQRREEIALQKSMATNTARLIDDPIGEVIVAPRKMIIMAAAFLLGLLIPGLIIFLRRTFYPVFSDKEELSRITSIPIIGEICGSEDTGHDGMVIGENVSTPIAELFRLLRNNVNITFHHRPGCKILLVTSTISGEGKTFISTNLAMTYALAGQKVLVIGGDIRRPVLARRLGLDNQRGLTTYISGQEHNLDRLIVPSTLNPNLFILPAGPVPPNPNELLMSENMDKLIDLLREKFDYVIIDSAPIGVVSDTFLIVGHTDQQLYVTRANYSTRGTIKTIQEAVRQRKFENCYIVINGVDINSNAYSYRRYGYYTSDKHRYGYGYEDAKGKSTKK